MELVIVTKDKVNPDPNKDKQCWKEGYLLTAMPDGHKWSELELNHPNYRIVRVPISETALQALWVRQDGIAEKKPDIRIRKYRFNLDLLTDKEGFKNQKG